MCLIQNKYLNLASITFQMNKLIFLIIIITLASCSPKHRPYFFSKKGERKIGNEQIKSLKIRLESIKDSRVITDRHLLTYTDPFIHTGDGKFCINAEKVYAKSFWTDMSNISKRYFSNFLGIHAVSSLIDEYDYKITWSVSDFRIKQMFSEEAYKNRNNHTYAYYAGGAVGGLLFAIADESINGNKNNVFKTKGNINITLQNIILYNKDNEIVKRFDDQVLLLEDYELVADAECQCAYYNLDYHFKKLLKEFAPKLESVLLSDYQKQN